MRPHVRYALAGLFASPSIALSLYLTTAFHRVLILPWLVCAGLVSAIVISAILGQMGGSPAIYTQRAAALLGTLSGVALVMVILAASVASGREDAGDPYAGLTALFFATVFVVGGGAMAACFLLAGARRDGDLW